MLRLHYTLASWLGNSLDGALNFLVKRIQLEHVSRRHALARGFVSVRNLSTAARTERSRSSSVTSAFPDASADGWFEPLCSEPGGTTSSGASATIEVCQATAETTRTSDAKEPIVLTEEAWGSQRGSKDLDAVLFAAAQPTPDATAVLPSDNGLQQSSDPTAGGQKKNGLSELARNTKARVEFIDANSQGGAYIDGPQASLNRGYSHRSNWEETQSSELIPSSSTAAGTLERILKRLLDRRSEELEAEVPRYCSTQQHPSGEGVTFGSSKQRDIQLSQTSLAGLDADIHRVLETYNPFPVIHVAPFIVEDIVAVVRKHWLRSRLDS